MRRRRENRSDGDHRLKRVKLLRRAKENGHESKSLVPVTANMRTHLESDACARVEEQDAVAAHLGEIEHLGDGVGDAIE
jgi:hypothetical protein